MAAPPSDVTQIDRFLLVERPLPVRPGPPRSMGRLRPPDALLFPAALDPGMRPRRRIRRQRKPAVPANGRAAGRIRKTRPPRAVSPCEVPALGTERSAGGWSSPGTFLPLRDSAVRLLSGFGPRARGAPATWCATCALLWAAAPHAAPATPAALRALRPASVFRRDVLVSPLPPQSVCLPDVPCGLSAPCFSSHSIPRTCIKESLRARLCRELVFVPLRGEDKT